MQASRTRAREKLPEYSTVAEYRHTAPKNKKTKGAPRVVTGSQLEGSLRQRITETWRMLQSHVCHMAYMGDL